MRTKPGTRVIILQDCREGASATKMQGVYEGDFPITAVVLYPDGNIGEYDWVAFEEWRAANCPDWQERTPDALGRKWMAETNPRIKLDDGSTIWGCQCWWGLVEGMPEWEEAQASLEEQKSFMRAVAQAMTEEAQK